MSLNINIMWSYSKTRLRLLNSNDTNTVKIQYFNGYDAIREKLDDNNILTVKQPVVNEKKNKNKSQYCIKLD